MSSLEIQHIVIVGGGSAGWLTAAVIAAAHPRAQGSNLRVTLLESPEVAPIGVGEGTWPSMRETLHRIGVSETDFVRACDAAFKQGSRFDGWIDGVDAHSYFHPFSVPHGYGEANLAARWRAAYPDTAFAELVSAQPALCIEARAPKQTGTPEYAGVANYGYHLDAGKFGEFLRAHACTQLGVAHVRDHVTGIDARPDGDIAALRTREHGAIEGDLFVDCTGSRALLLGGHYGVPLRSQKHFLFNDSALAVQVPYPREDSPIASPTISSAREAGWIWDIGLPSRRGVGYVYSSAHTNDDDAQRVLQDYLKLTGSPAQAADVAAPRKLSFQPGYRERFWERNCVAVGQAAGFIEPLEASALAMVELSAAMIADTLPATRAAMPAVARRFNDTFGYRWERVIEFLKLHYVLSTRTDSDYWRDNRAEGSIPARLQESLALWKHRPPSRHDFPRIEEIFPAASYQYVLYGMGFATAYGDTPHDGDQPAQADRYFRENAALIRRMLGGLPNNRELLDHVRRHGMPRGQT
jgi:tryptophan halogenase